MLIEWVRRSLSPSWIFSKATSKSPWLLGHQRFLSLWLLTTSCNIRSWPLGCETHQLCFRGLCRKYCQELLIVRPTWMILLSIHLYGQIMLKRWVFDWLVAANLTLNLAKCDFCKGRCYLFGQKGWPGQGCVGENNCCRVPHSHNKKRAA